MSLVLVDEVLSPAETELCHWCCLADAVDEDGRCGPCRVEQGAGITTLAQRSARRRIRFVAELDARLAGIDRAA